MKKLILIVCVLLCFMICGCEEEPIAAAGNASGSAPYAIEASHHGTKVKWVVPDFNDIRQCTDEELLNIAIFCAVGTCASDGNDFVWFGNKLMPERFKIKPAKE